MQKTRFLTRSCVGICLGITVVTAHGQGAPDSTMIPVATRWVPEAANPVQRNSIKSVFLMYCPATQMKGTSFLLNTGIIVTNNHVVKGCTKDDLWTCPLF